MNEHAKSIRSSESIIRCQLKDIRQVVKTVGPSPYADEAIRQLKRAAAELRKLGHEIERATKGR